MASATGVPLILVVEHGPAVIDFCEFVLHQAGYRVAASTDGKVGLALAEELHPALILLDLMISEVDGLTFLDRIRQMPEPRPRVIGMSGFDRFEPEALQRGAAAFLAKPIDSRELLAMVGAVLSGARVEPSVMVQQAQRVARLRQSGRQRRAALLDRVDFDAPDVRDRLRALVRWTASYFGVSISFINVHRGDRIHHQAVFGKEVEAMEGTSVDERMLFCADVTEAGAPMLLTDAAQNAVYATHPATLAGYRFYAGTPIVTPSGVVIGTLCLCDQRPRVLHGEDLMVLESLAEGVGRHIEGLAAGRDVAGAFVVPGVLSREVVEVLIRGALQRFTREGGGLALAAFDLGREDPALERRSADLVYQAAGNERLAVAELSSGRGILCGDPSPDGCRGRLDRALAALRDAGIPLRGTGIVSLVEPAPTAIDVVTLEALAHEACRRSEQNGAGVERIVLTRAELPQPSAP